MSEKVYFLTICLPLATVLLVFGMKYLSAVLQARARLASDEAYSRIAEQAAAAQLQAAHSLAAIQAMLADVSQRVSTMERILKEVE
jgi:Tfp pilus assembly protein PilO